MTAKDKKKGKRRPPTIDINLKGFKDSLVYHPGETVAGVVEIRPRSEIKCRGVEIKMGWHTEGKGDRDEGILNTINVDVGVISEQMPVVEHFDFTMPDSPWTFHGRYINIVWAIEVKVDIALSPDINATQKVILKPRPDRERADTEKRKS